MSPEKWNTKFSFSLTWKADHVWVRSIHLIIGSHHSLSAAFLSNHSIESNVNSDIKGSVRKASFMQPKVSGAHVLQGDNKRTGREGPSLVASWCQRTKHVIHMEAALSKLHLCVEQPSNSLETRRELTLDKAYWFSHLKELQVAMADIKQHLGGTGCLNTSNNS